VGPNANLTVDNCQFLNCRTQALAAVATAGGCANCPLSYEGMRERRTRLEIVISLLFCFQLLEKCIDFIFCLFYFSFVFFFYV
jgi:hypothetical protein